MESDMAGHLVANGCCQRRDGRCYRAFRKRPSAWGLAGLDNLSFPCQEGSYTDARR